jgi:hypothetical protein
MKKIPLFFCCLLMACSASRQVVNNTTIYNKHPEPYYVYSVGRWNSDYVILTLIDSRNQFFDVKTGYTSTLKKGDVYKP